MNAGVVGYLADKLVTKTYRSLSPNPGVHALSLGKYNRPKQYIYELSSLFVEWHRRKRYFMNLVITRYPHETGQFGAVVRVLLKFSIATL